MDEIHHLNEFSKDTQFIVSYFDKRFQTIENELKLHSTLLHKLLQTSFPEEPIQKSPAAIPKISNKTTERNSPSFGYPTKPNLTNLSKNSVNNNELQPPPLLTDNTNSHNNSKHLIVEPIEVEFHDSLIKPSNSTSNLESNIIKPVPINEPPIIQVAPKPIPPVQPQIRKIEEKKIPPNRTSKTPTNAKRTVIVDEKLKPISIVDKFKPVTRSAAISTKSPRAPQTTRGTNKFSSNSRNANTKSTTSLIPMKSPKNNSVIQKINPISTKHSSTLQEIPLKQINEKPLKSSSMINVPKTYRTLELLPGRCLDLIAEFHCIGFPLFVLSSKKTLSQYSSYKVEEYGVQIELLQDEYNQTKNEILPNYKTHPFKLLQSTKMEYDNLKIPDWNIFLNSKLDQLLTPKDITILKIYLTFMGKDFIKKDNFLTNLKQYFINLANSKILLSKALDPEINFIFNEQIIKKLIEFFVTLKNQSVNISGASSYEILNILAEIVIEALKFAQIMPGPQDGELSRLGKEIAKCKKIKSILEKYALLSPKK